MTATTRGRLVAFEGVDGSGKTTQAQLLSVSLGAVLTFEPGATELGRALRHLLLDPGRPPPVPRAEVLLMAADRAQHVDEVVLPALESGRWVVTDRFSGSTLAYQGWGRGLPAEPLRRVVSWAAAGLEPDLTVLVDVPLEVARQRLGAVARDRLEGLDADFHDRVRHGFVAMARADEAHWVMVDGTLPVATLAVEIEALVRTRLGSPAPS
ncbi:MAG: dTMP kinase [Acidimicrobiales bacterium]